MTGTRGRFGRIVAMGLGLAVALLLLVARRGEGGQVLRSPSAAGTSAPTPTGPTRPAAPSSAPTPSACRPPGRPLRRRPSEELHPRGAGHRLRHPLRPLALGGAARHRHHPGQRHLVARAARRHGAPPRRRHLEWRLRRLRRCRRDRHAPAPFVAGFIPPSRPSRTACSAPGRRANGAASTRSRGLAVRALTITIQDDLRPGAGIGGDVLAGGWRRGSQGVGFWGGDTGGGHPLRGDLRRRRPRRPHRVPLREGVHRRRVAGDADAALPARRLGRGDDRHHRFSDGPHTSATASPTSPATSAAPPTTPSASTTTRRPIRAD